MRCCLLNITEVTPFVWAPCGYIYPRDTLLSICCALLCHQRMHHLEMVLTKRKTGSGDKIGPNQPLALSWEMLVILFRSKECGDQTFCLTYIFSHCLAMLHLSKGYAAFYMLCHQRTHHLRKLGMCQII